MVSSRIAAREQKKMLTQTLLFLVGAVVLAVGFLFVILPGVTRLWSAIAGNGAVSFDESDTLAPQVPIMSAPVEATNSAQIVLNGFGEAKSQLKIVVNGEAKSETTIGDDGTFSVPLELNAGDNTVNAFSVDQAGNESELSRSYHVAVDTEVPQLTITEPQNGQTIELRKNQMVTIKGSTEPMARISVNGRLVSANSEGLFSTTYLLQEGENKLLLKVTDLAGNSSEQELIVQFRF